MLTQQSASELPDWVTGYLEPALWWVTVAFFAIEAVYFAKKYKERKGVVGSQFLLGLAVFSIGYGVGRALENIRKYIIAEDRDDIFKGWIGLAEPISGVNLAIRTIYYIVCWIAIAVFYYEMEQQVFRGKTRYIFTVTAIFEGTVSIAQYYTYDHTSMIVIAILATIGFFVAGLTPPVIYIQLGLKSTGIIKRSCFLSALGILMFVFAVVADLPESQLVVYLTSSAPLAPWITSIVAPILMFSGVVVMILSFRMMFSDLF